MTYVSKHLLTLHVPCMQANYMYIKLLYCILKILNQWAPCSIMNGSVLQNEDRKISAAAAEAVALDLIDQLYLWAVIRLGVSEGCRSKSPSLSSMMGF